MYKLGIFLGMCLFSLQVHGMGRDLSCAPTFGSVNQAIVYDQSSDDSKDDGKDDKKEGGSEAEPDCE